MERFRGLRRAARALATGCLAGWILAMSAAGTDVSRETSAFFETLRQVSVLQQENRCGEAAALLRPWLQDADTAHRAAILLVDLLPRETSDWASGSTRERSVVAFQYAYAYGRPGTTERLREFLTQDPEVFTWEGMIGPSIADEEKPDFLRRLRTASKAAPGNPFLPLALAHLEGRAERFRLTGADMSSLRARDAAFVLGEILYRLNRRSASGRLCARNLALAQAAGDHWRTVDCLLQQATQLLQGGDLDGADLRLEDADRETQALPLGLLRRRLNFLRGYTAVHRGAFPEAARFFRSVLPAASAGGYTRLQAHALVNLGYVLDECGDYEEALDCYRRVIPFYRANRDWFSLALARLDRGALRMRLNLLDAACRDFEAILALPNLPADSEPRLMAASNLGAIYGRRRMWNQAIPLLREALDMARRCRMAEEAAALGSNLAICLLGQGDLPAAREANAVAEQTLGLTASPLVTLYVAGVDARILTAGGDPTGALQRIQTLAPLATRMEDRSQAWLFACFRGRALAALGNHQEALACFDEALRGITELEESCADLYLTLNFLENGSDVVEDALASLYALLEAGAPPTPLLEKAFDIMEAYRGRVLRRHLDARAPRPPEHRRPSLATVRSWLRTRGAAALMLFEGENRLYLLTLDGDRAVLSRVATGPIRDTVDRLDARFRHGQAGRDPAAEMALTARLWQSLPSGSLAGNGELFVLPAGALCRIPLEMLPESRSVAAAPLGIRRPIIYLPSWEFLDRSVGSASTITHTPSYLGLYGFNDTTSGRWLPFAKREVAVGADALNWTHARLEPAVRLTGHRLPAPPSGGAWSIVHLATHVEVDEEDPWRSRLLLGPGSSPPGSLALADLAEGVWESNLVVLSGCATGRGRVFRSEGAISLARACLVSGSRSVLTTLWPVADRTAAEFMRAFYDSLPACGGEVAPALMEARRRLRANAAFASPFHWAGFVLYGLPDPIPAPAASNGWSSVFLLVWATLLLLWLVRIAQSLRGGGRP